LKEETMEVTGNRISARWVIVALVAVLGLAVMAAGSAPASGSPQAAVAKKCKKKRGVSAAKKKKCKKHKVVLPAPAPLVRGKLSWSGGAADSEVDLHAFDSSGNHTGWVNSTSGVVNGIPNAVHSGDVHGVSGAESFTDNIFVIGGPANREFSYVACVYDSVSATFTGVARNGQVSTLSVAPGQTNFTIPGGPPVPPAFICP
jgi:hypothetical protein